MTEQNEEQAIEGMAKAICHAPTCEIKKNVGRCYKYCKAYIYAFRAINKGYRKQSEWISVDERLPDGEGYFLVWNNERKKIEIRFFYRLPPDYPVESHPEIREYFGNFADYKRITHWMPLPEPPKMKGGAE